jgi:hypothetical protein
MCEAEVMTSVSSPARAVQLIEVEMAYVTHPPSDAERHGDRPVVVNGEPWLLVASRQHPTTGTMNALLASPDRQRAVVVPLDQVEQRPVEPAVEARLAPDQKGLHLVQTPVEPPSVDTAASGLAAAFKGQVVEPDPAMEV